MTQESDKSTVSDDAKDMRTLRIYMRNRALSYLDSLDARSARILESLNLFKSTDDPANTPIDFEALNDPKHPRRIPLPDGPLVAIRSESMPNAITFLEIPLLLLSDKSENRSAALALLTTHITENRLKITEGTQATLESTKGSIVSGGEAEWRTAAVSLYDSLSDDIHVSIQGAHQTLATQFSPKEHLNLYIPRILTPKIESILAIKATVPNPEIEHPGLLAEIDACVNSSRTLSELCSEYCRRLGHMPLAEAYSMSAAVHKWWASHTEEACWDTIWAWVTDTPGPLPMYHACFFFLLNSELIPPDKMPDLWGKVMAIVLHKEGSDWDVMDSLARHYCFHFEARLPNRDGRQITPIAWWLASHVAAILQPKEEALKFYKEKWVKPAVEISGHVYLMASSTITPCQFRYLTLSGHSTWTRSLLMIAGQKSAELKLRDQPAEVRDLFCHAIRADYFQSLSVPTQPLDDPTYAFDLPYKVAFDACAEFIPEELVKAIRSAETTSQTLTSDDGLKTALRDTPPDHDIQRALGGIIRAKSLTNPLKSDPIWEVVSDVAWRKNTLAKLDMDRLDNLVASLVFFQNYDRDRWAPALPHYLAELCEGETDPAKVGPLFLMLVYACIASDSVSAMQRLLRGPHCKRYKRAVLDYRTNAEGMRKYYPGWVAGKMRALMACLRIA